MYSFSWNASKHMKKEKDNLIYIPLSISLEMNNVNNVMKR